MKIRNALAAAMMGGLALGVVATKVLHAQGKPPAYVVIDIREMTDPEGFKTILTNPAASPAGIATLGGSYVIRTEDTVALEGTVPKRLIVIAFDSTEKAQAWYNAPAVKEINAIRARTTKSNTFIVEGAAN